MLVHLWVMGFIFEGCPSESVGGAWAVVAALTIIFVAESVYIYVYGGG